MIRKWKQQAQELKELVVALSIAYRDPRTPWRARVIIACIVGYALSPIDLIPDPIPVLGYLDDLMLLPLGVLLAVRLIPSAVWTDAQEQARTSPRTVTPASWIAAILIITLWIATTIVGGMLVWRWL